MNIRNVFLILLLSLCSFSLYAFGERGGYEHPNETYHEPPSRSNSDNSVNDSWSNQGNIDPYAGKEETIPQDKWNNRY